MKCYAILAKLFVFLNPLALNLMCEETKQITTEFMPLMYFM